MPNAVLHRVQNKERWPSGRRHPLAKRFLAERWDGSSNLPLSVCHAEHGTADSEGLMANGSQ